MKLNGTHTAYIEVDVSSMEIIDKACSILVKNFNLANRCVSQDGYWMEYSGINHHNGEEEYMKTEYKPTKDEIEAISVVNYLRKIRYQVKE